MTHLEYSGERRSNILCASGPAIGSEYSAIVYKFWFGVLIRQVLLWHLYIAIGF